MVIKDDRVRKISDGQFGQISDKMIGLLIYTSLFGIINLFVQSLNDFDVVLVDVMVVLMI